MSWFNDLLPDVVRHCIGPENRKLSKPTALRWGSHGSLSVDQRKAGHWVWYSHEEGKGGGVIDFLKWHAGHDYSAALAWMKGHFNVEPPPRPTPEPPRQPQAPVTVYEYYDGDGVMRFQVCKRTNPKSFWQRQPDGNGGFINNLDGVDLIPYQLPDLLHPNVASGKRWVFLVEGEKDVDRLRAAGLTATCNPAGAGKWLEQYGAYLSGASVVIIPDNDRPGYLHACDVATKLRGVATKIRFAALPGLPHKGDVSDWLDTHSADELKAFVADAPPFDFANPPQYESPDDAEEPDTPEPEAPPSDDIFDTLDFDGLDALPPPTWLIDGLITDYGSSLMYGEPSAGKSFLAIDMALHVAYGREWNGRAVTQGGVLYIAGEGVRGLAKRIAAWRSKHGAAGKAPFRLLPVAVNMLDEAQVDKLIRTIDRHLDDMDFRLVVIDTVARAMVGGDENTAQDMGKFVAATDRVREHMVRKAEGGDLVSAGLLSIHHSGKDKERGARGSNSLPGAVDTMIRVERRENYLTATVEKQKDAEAGEPMTFEMIKQPLPGSVSESSLVLELLDAGPAPANEDGATLSWEQIGMVFDAINKAWHEGKPWSNQPQAKAQGRYLPRWIALHTPINAKQAADLVSGWLMHGHLAVDMCDRKTKTKGLKVERWLQKPTSAASEAA